MSYSSEQKSIRQFVRDIIPKSYLPAIQRELVWGMDRIENLFDSITRGYPIGTLLLWNVRKPAIHEYSFYELVRDYDVASPHNTKANLDELTECYGILDGQQRTTALYLGLKGSFREKRPRKWRSSPDAFVVKRLYLNLLHVPAPELEERKFEYRFLSESEAGVKDDTHYWYRLGDILRYESEQQLRDWRRTTDYRDNTIFEDNLAALWRAVEHPTGIAYFLESGQDLNEVLTIFVRMNMGGEPLSYSDLLLSLATATWKSHDARQEVYALVDKLNKDCGSDFWFSKDFVLKTLLVLNDGDVRFRTENIRRKADLEERWEKVKVALPLAVRLIAGYKFNGQTLTAANAAIPIAYYLYSANHNDSFLTSRHFEADREKVRLWLLTVLVGRAFGGQSDTVLSRARGVLRESNLEFGFPKETLLAKMNADQNLALSSDMVPSLVDGAYYGNPLTFLLLSMVTPMQLDPSICYHVDHMHPKALFTKAELTAQGVPEADMMWIVERQNHLANLQLLCGGVNQSKLQTPLIDWLERQQNPEFYRTLGLVPDNVDLRFCSFRTFFEARRHLLIERLKVVFGFQEASANTVTESYEVEVGETNTEDLLQAQGARVVS